MYQLCFDVYAVWPFCPTRLNVADDPTRDVAISGLGRASAFWIEVMLICAPEWVEAFRCKLDSFGLADLVASFRRGGLPQILLWVLSGGLLSASLCLL